jgi:nucleoside-diphosphate-sugar epimerase
VTPRADDGALVVFGASGFIGTHLVRRAAARWTGPVLAVARRPMPGVPERAIVIDAALEQLAVAPQTLPAGSVVVNVAFAVDAGVDENVALARRLADVCCAIDARRLVHVSTATVVGDAGGRWVDETTPCHPVTDYQAAKLAVEMALKDRLAGRVPVVILRPTAVFGPGGRNLLKLAGDLRGRSALENYVRSSLFGRRPMNLVPVETVVDAVLFAASAPRAVEDGLYLVADDEVPANNFRDVERVIRRALGRPALPLPPLPLSPLLGIVHRVAGRRAGQTRVRYSGRRLRDAGFTPPATFGEALDAYAATLAGPDATPGRAT